MFGTFLEGRHKGATVARNKRHASEFKNQGSVPTTRRTVFDMFGWKNTQKIKN